MVFLIVLVVFLFTEPVISQSNDHAINTNIPTIQSFCGSIAPLNQNFFKNRNATLAEIRMKLLNEGVVYATAQDLTAGDSVYAAAQCRNYVSRDECVACFDAGVSILVKCMQGNGAYVVFDNCFIRQRYQNSGDVARNVEDGALIFLKDDDRIAIEDS